MNKKTPAIAIIGGGVMGEVIVKNLRQKIKVRGEKITLIDKNPARLKQLQKKYKINTGRDLKFVEGSTLVFLAVKPQQFGKAANKLKENLTSTQTIISIMAGFGLKSIQRKLSHKKVVRTMPNIAAQISRGVTLWSADKSVSKNDLRLIKKIFNSFGSEYRISSDSQIDALTLVNGCGPAYLFYLCEILECFAGKYTEDKAMAEKIVADTLSGALELYKATGDGASALRKKVTSKGGVTEAMFDVIEKKYRSSSIWSKSFDNALKRTKSIKKKYE